MQLSKLGEWITAGDFIVGGSPHLHAVDDRGAKVTQPSGEMLTVAVLDAPVVNLGWHVVSLGLI